MDRIMLDLQAALHRAQERYKRASDAHRSQPPELPAGTLGWLLSKHICWHTHCQLLTSTLTCFLFSLYPFIRLICLVVISTLESRAAQ
jgi:hypothetical protein